jgi:acyl carrier protein
MTDAVMAQGTDLEAALERLLLKRLNIAVPSTDYDLMASGLLDSLALVELLLALEQEFRLPISMGDLEFENFRSVAAIAAFVERQVGLRSVGG